MWAAKGRILKDRKRKAEENGDVVPTKKLKVSRAEIAAAKDVEVPEGVVEKIYEEFVSKRGEHVEKCVEMEHGRILIAFVILKARFRGTIIVLRNSRARSGSLSDNK
jgi:hypothetical protein